MRNNTSFFGACPHLAWTGGAQFPSRPFNPRQSPITSKTSASRSDCVVIEALGGMSHSFLHLRRGWKAVSRRVREFRMIGRGLASTRHPILAHVIPMRRCNLACAYCNEYDKVSDPVPTAEMLRRIEILAAMGTGIITISGGEPLLHPDLDEIIRAIRSHGAIATIITNGYLLTPERIERLNRAGLEHLQISIDNVMPDEVSKKSLKVLDRKLQWLREHAQFDVNINSVLGGGMAHPEDALTIT